MKKVFVISVILMLPFIFLSCNKDDQSSPIKIEDLSTKATLRGSVSAELDLTVAGLEAAPTGTKIIFRIAANQFTNRPLQNNFLIYETTVTATGTYLIELPVTNAGVNIDIIPVDFEAQQRIAPGSGLDKFQTKVFSANQSTVNLVAGQVKFRNIQYN